MKYAWDFPGKRWAYGAAGAFVYSNLQPDPRQSAWGTLCPVALQPLLILGALQSSTGWRFLGAGATIYAWVSSKTQESSPERA